MSMKRLGDDVLVQPGMRLGESGAPLRSFDLCNAELTSDEQSPISAVVHNDDPAKMTSDPPAEMLVGLDEREAFMRLPKRQARHLHASQFDFEETL